ncbi:MAG: patatin family protein [Lachnospiraceae bacterium]|nr:patatin family protein [Lachnospiraceae bacterium]
MKETIYSRLNQIPKGEAGNELINACLVVEGGALRGLYNQGVMDVWMKQGINFSCVIGVSAGALAGMNYVSGQIGRSARANLGHRHESDYMGLGALKKSKSFIRLDYLFQDYENIEPLNAERFYDEKRRFIAVVTNVETGQTEYMEKGKCSDILAAIKASASMPYVSKPVEIDGVPYLDGGCSCKLAYQWALDQGYEKIIVIRTREQGFRKKITHRNLEDRFYKDYPEFAKTLSVSNEKYNRQCAEVERLENIGRLFAIYPSKPVEVGRVEGDMEKLGQLYWLGYSDALSSIERLKEYLDK